MSPTNKKKHGKSKTATTTPEISPPDMSSHTRVAFRDFIELADVDTINTFLAATTSTLESENLKLLWKRAYKEGFENGQKAIQPILQRVGRKLEEKFEKGVARGMNIGREEGYTVAKEAFDRMLVEIEARDTPKASTGDANIQTNPPIATTTSVSTQTYPPVTATTSVSIQTSPTMCAATSHSQTLSENAKKLENLLNHSEISPKLAVFSPQTPSVTTLDPLEPSTTTTVLKTRSTAANFTENHQKVENLPNLSQNSPQTHSPSTSEHLDDVARVYTSLRTLNDIVSQPPTLKSAASSPHPPASPEHEKSARLCAVFESKLPTGSLASSTIVSASKMRLESSNFTKISQNIENQPIFIQNSTEPLVSDHSKCEDDFESPQVPTTIFTAFETRSETAEFMEKHKKTPIHIQKPPELLVSRHLNWADDAAELPISSTVPTKQPRDLSGLRSRHFSKNPFSSLQRRRPKFNKNKNHFINSKSQYYHHHAFPSPYHHSQKPHYHPQSPFSVSLNWDQDPRLVDLGTALQALGWIRA